MIASEQRASTSRTRRNVLAIGSLLTATAIGAVSTGSAMAQHHHEGGGASCFLKGTRIRVPGGEKKIEDLQIGDPVLTQTGEVRPVQWIARRLYHKPPNDAWPTDILPIRITRDALGSGLPEVDLLISPNHALHFDGVFIPVVELANGTTIAPCLADDLHQVQYFHLKLEAHDVIYAEGVECESLRLSAAFEAFDNVAEYEERYGKPGRIAEPSFAPRLGFMGRRSIVASRLRSAVSPIVDRRTPLDRARDHIEERAVTLCG
jgi:hypothetical protein